jgi:hypothetical protein
MYLVDVKGIHRVNPWIVKRKAPRAMLFYVLAYVPANDACDAGSPDWLPPIGEDRASALLWEPALLWEGPRDVASARQIDVKRRSLFGQSAPMLTCSGCDMYRNRA